MSFEASLGSAVGGFLGVTLFFLVRLWIEVRRSSPEEIQTYICGNAQNKGQEDECEGELMHHHGKRLSDKNEYIELGASNPLWEWTRDTCGRKPTGASVIYGPYSTDFSEPGMYSATFFIRGIGFSKPDEIIDDLILLEVDVSKMMPQYSTDQGKLEIIGAQYKMARQFIRAKHLAKGGWLEFELSFWSDAQGVWEYRIVAYDGLDNKPDNIGKYGANVRILFDKVVVRKINKFKLPWV